MRGRFSFRLKPARQSAPGPDQVEDEEKVPDSEAELAVVAMLTVPAIVAVVPEAVLVTVKVADPTPPDTSSSISSLSSMKTSTITQLQRPAPHAPW